MPRRLALALALVLLAGTPACAQDGGPAPEPSPAAPTPTARTPTAREVEFETIAKGPHVGGGGAGGAAENVVVRDRAALEALWARVHGGAAAAPPEIDFAKEIVIAVFAGEKPTLGYEVEIVRVEAAGGGYIVAFREQAPRPGAIVGQAVSHPGHVVRAPRVEGEVRFRRE